MEAHHPSILVTQLCSNAGFYSDCYMDAQDRINDAYGEPSLYIIIGMLSSSIYHVHVSLMFSYLHYFDRSGNDNIKYYTSIGDASSAMAIFIAIGTS
jgi:hypothetical protein